MATRSSGRVAGSRSVAGFRSAATRSSRDAQVASNIPASQVALWNRVKGQFKGSLEQRTRAFKQYVHDHPRESHAALQDHADRKVAAMIAGRGGGGGGSFRTGSHAWFTRGRSAGSPAAESSYPRGSAGGGGYGGAFADFASPVPF